MAIGKDAETRKWWRVCEPCQKSLTYDYEQSTPGHTADGSSPGGDWWPQMEQMFHDNWEPITYRNVETGEISGEESKPASTSSSSLLPFLAGAVVGAAAYYFYGKAKDKK